MSTYDATDFDKDYYLSNYELFENICLTDVDYEKTEFSDDSEDMAYEIAYLRFHYAKLEVERDQLRAEYDAYRETALVEADLLRADMTKIKGLVENILVNHVEGREFMTSSQLYEAVIQDCTAALNVGRANERS